MKLFLARSVAHPGFNYFEALQKFVVTKIIKKQMNGKCF